MTKPLVAIVVLTCLAAPARAEDEAQHTAASVVNAPRPDETQNLLVAEDRLSATLAWIPRVLLFVPRYAVELAFQPVRGGLWVYERYQLGPRFRELFFNDAGTFGVYPTAFLETGFGLNAGARLVHSDLFGSRESLRFRASFGGRFRQSYAARLDSGDRFGDRLVLSLRGEYHIRPKERFFGIGNADLADASMAPLPVDALTTDLAISTRFREHVGRVTSSAALRLTGALRTRLTAAWVRRTFADPDDADGETAISEAYLPMGVVDFGTGLSTAYGELEIDLDTRSVASPFFSTALPSRGWRLTGFVGAFRVLDHTPRHFLRWGLDLQRYFDVYAHNRVVVLRLFAEGVTGGLDEVPFVELPRLGGNDLLRGYPEGRFRDRVAVVGQAEYLWDLGRSFAGYLFVDGGRVWPELGDLALRDLRMGFGGGFQAHTMSQTMFRLQVASSIDGGLYVSVVLNPLHQLAQRVERF
jgi:hypothetical protein